VDNHWALRDFASRLMANICKNFNTSTNNVQTRITRVFSEAMKSERAPLVSYYGAIAGLQELGPEVIKVFILPHVKAISQRIDVATDPALMASSTMGNIEKIAANHIRNLIVKSVSPIIKTTRAPPDVVEEFRTDFGSLGPFLHAAVARTRTPSSQKGAAVATPARPTLLTQTSIASAPGTPGTTQQQRVYLVGTPQQQQQQQQQQAGERERLNFQI
jgi:transcription initiation factor TFIID subunit 6